MRKINNWNVLANLSGAVAASMVLASCATKPPVQTTNVTVTVPSPTEGAAKPNAVVRDESGAAPEKPVVEIDENPQPDAPRAASKSAPKAVSKPAPKAVTASAEKSQLLDFYDRLPAKHFAMFQNGDRRALLKRKGVTIDYKHRFIEIPGSADARDGDLRALQMTLFPNGKEPWCAVSRIVWPQDKTPGTLDFYYDSAEGLRKVAEGFFPYDLEKSDMGFRSAWLPRRGLNIIVSIVDDPMSGNIYHYNRDFRVGQAAFYPVDNYED